MYIHIYIYTYIYIFKLLNLVCYRYPDSTKFWILPDSVPGLPRTYCVPGSRTLVVRVCCRENWHNTPYCSSTVHEFTTLFFFILFGGRTPLFCQKCLGSWPHPKTLWFLFWLFHHSSEKNMGSWPQSLEVEKMGSRPQLFADKRSIPWPHPF